MRRLEVFFDYACPYCLRGHELLLALLPAYPDVEVVWRPCESHPRPDRYGPHSDLCIRGMYYARSKKADLWEYHRRVYRAVFTDRADVEHSAPLARAVAGLLDPQEFQAALDGGAFQRELDAGNAYAFRRSGVWVVPAYRMEGRRLDAVEDVGVTGEQLAAFLGPQP